MDQNKLALFGGKVINRPFRRYNSIGKKKFMLQKSSAKWKFISIYWWKWSRFLGGPK